MRNAVGEASRFAFENRANRGVQGVLLESLSSLSRIHRSPFTVRRVNPEVQAPSSELRTPNSSQAKLAFRTGTVYAIKGIVQGSSLKIQVIEDVHGLSCSGRSRCDRLPARWDRLALAPQVLAEFIHAVTDDYRFARVDLQSKLPLVLVTLKVSQRAKRLPEPGDDPWRLLRRSQRPEFRFN